MSAVTIYHNPQCSKSRATLELLQQQQIQPQIRLYLETPPTVTELARIVQLLGFSSVRQLIRRNNELYRQLGLDDNSLTEASLLSLLSQHPALIERPIVVTALGARIGRPPQQVLEIIPD